MSGKSKRGGRVTPKGTKNPEKPKKERKGPDVSPESDPFAGTVPGKVQRERGRAARPITHHRGNR